MVGPQMQNKHSEPERRAHAYGLIYAWGVVYVYVPLQILLYGAIISCHVVTRVFALSDIPAGIASVLSLYLYPISYVTTSKDRKSIPTNNSPDLT